MNDSTSSSSSGGLGFCGALAILFIALKLLGKIGWSWWWVLSPLWIPWVIVLPIVITVLVVVLVKNHNDKKRLAAAHKRTLERRYGIK